MKMKKGITAKVLGFCILIPIVTAILVFLFVVATIEWEYLSVKWDIDNPYVDNNFKEWKKVSIEGLDDFKIPKGWTLSQESENLYCIYDGSGQVWARGTFTSSDHYIQPLEQVLSMPITKVSGEDFIPIYMMNGSDTGIITVYSDGKAVSYQKIEFFVTVETDFTWILMHDISVDEQQCDIAEAIQYSYAYQK